MEGGRRQRATLSGKAEASLPGIQTSAASLQVRTGGKSNREPAQLLRTDHW